MGRERTGATQRAQRALPHALPRVLLVLGTSGGGVGRHVAALAASLVQSGVTVHVAAPAAVGEELDFAGAGATFTAVEIRERPHPRGDLKVVATIGRLAEDVDVVHAHGLRAGGLAVLALRRSSVPLAVTLHNALLAQGVGGSPVRAAYAVLERLVARGADITLGVSADLELRLRELGARDVRHAVVPAPAALAARTTPEQTREALGLHDEAVVLCVARLAEQKGLPLLLDATQVLAADATVGRRFTVLVAGDGPLRDRLAARIEADGLPVRLLGWRDDVGDLLTVADVVVSSAVWEGQPIAVQQALQAGAAVVATDVGGTAEVTEDAALLVPGGDAAALAAGVRRLLSDPRARDELRARARRRAAQLPDDAAARDAALQVYDDLRRAGRST
ncbi:MAG TPA: glycosyltransferase [Angustibacter sp.]|nr:glycosyltransferase [Angustibacter sp.]